MSLYFQHQVPQNVINLFNKYTNTTTPYGPISEIYPECNNNCWMWTGSYYPDNPRGIISTYVNGKKLTLIAYRISYLIYNGDIPNGALVCHKCDNPSCVNPNHLFLGSPKDNMEDARNKNRAYQPEQNHGGVLTEQIIIELLNNIYNNRFTSTTEVAKYYNVDVSTVNKILTGKTWRIITDKLPYSLSNLRKNMKNSTSKCNYIIATQIRNDYQQNNMIIKDLMIKYNMCRRSIYDIINYKTYV